MRFADISGILNVEAFDSSPSIVCELRAPAFPFCIDTLHWQCSRFCAKFSWRKPFFIHFQTVKRHSLPNYHAPGWTEDAGQWQDRGAGERHSGERDKRVHAYNRRQSPASGTTNERYGAFARSGIDSRCRRGLMIGHAWVKWNRHLVKKDICAFDRDTGFRALVDQLLIWQKAASI